MWSLLSLNVCIAHILRFCCLFRKHFVRTSSLPTRRKEEEGIGFLVCGRDSEQRICVRRVTSAVGNSCMESRVATQLFFLLPPSSPRLPLVACSLVTLQATYWKTTNTVLR